MTRYSFIARMPDESGALHRAAEIVKRYGGNINRLQYDRRIDPGTVFFEVTADEPAYGAINRELEAIGYLRTSLAPLSFLKMYVHIPNQPGALHEFLQYITRARANIAFIDYDDRGRAPERLTVSLNLEVSDAVERLLDSLKSRYRLEVLEYDTTGANLDNTVFYVRFAQQLRALIGESEEQFLLSFLGDVNHVAQQMMDLGKDPHQVFEKIIENGKFLQKTSGADFSADVQKIPVTETVTLWCFQLPGGGNVFLLAGPDDMVLIDTGYAIYHDRILEMLGHFGICDVSRLSRIFITHADADHSGGAGLFDVPSYLHHGTLSIIETANRAYGSRSEESILEEVYTKMINTLSRFTVPSRPVVLPKKPIGMRGAFPVVDRFTVGDVELEVLEGTGGHQHGQCFLSAPDAGLLFTADAVFNFEHLTPERDAYNQIAVFLVLTVDVDKDLAKEERRALLELARKTDAALSPKGKRCLVCGGHGPVSILEGKSMVPWGAIERYAPERR